MSIRFRAPDYAADVAAISESIDFERATIEIRDPSLLTRVTDIKTGTIAYAGDPIVATGVRARGIGTRAVSDATDGTVSDATTVKPYRWQFPADAYAGRILRGWQIRVLDGGRNPRLETMLFTVRSDIQGSNMASRTIECQVDPEAFAQWIDPADGPSLLPSVMLYPSEDLLPNG